MGNEPYIGIDLGTTNSVVATVSDGRPMVIRSRAGLHLTPSVVSLTVNGDRLVGLSARQQAFANPENTAYAVKRFIGRKWSSPEVQRAREVLPFALVEGPNDDVRVRLAGKTFALPEISAMLLAELKLDAEAFFGRPVSQAVITVPAYFNDGQRQATKDAGQIAGLEVMHILNEPTAAALAYGYGQELNRRLVVFDLGGGTFDLSVLDVAGGVFNVLATGGDTYLGGEDFDTRLVEWLLAELKREQGVDLSAEREALQRLKEAAERAKCDLSSAPEVELSVPFIHRTEQGVVHLAKVLTRDQLEALTEDLSQRCLSICERVLGEAGIGRDESVEPVMVGGMTRMPRLRALVAERFGREPPTGVNPDEVVALGAAVHASVLARSTQGMQLLDVTPHSLGVAIAGGYARTLVARNTRIPAKATQVFATSHDGQREAKIAILQGESGIATENQPLGYLSLSGLPTARRGEVEIEVSFDIGADGILSVSATDRATGKQQKIAVTASGGLSQSELQRLAREQKERMDQVQRPSEAVTAVTPVTEALLQEAAQEAGPAAPDEAAATLRRMIDEVELLMSSIEPLLAGVPLGTEVMKKATQALSGARSALEAADPVAMADSAEVMSRTLQVFHAIMQSAGRAA